MKSSRQAFPRVSGAKLQFVMQKKNSYPKNLMAVFFVPKIKKYFKKPLFFIADSSFYLQLAFELKAKKGGRKKIGK